MGFQEEYSKGVLNNGAQNGYSKTVLKRLLKSVRKKGCSSTSRAEAHPSASTAAAVLSAYAVRCDLSRAQRRHACRRARLRRPTSATPTRPHARRRSRRRAGRTSPTRRVRAMRSARPAFPHCPYSPRFSSRHPPAARCIALALGPPPGRVTALHAPESTMALRTARRCRCGAARCSGSTADYPCTRCGMG